MVHGCRLDGLEGQEGIHMQIKLGGTKYQEDGTDTDVHEFGHNHIGKEVFTVGTEDRS